MDTVHSSTEIFAGGGDQSMFIRQSTFQYLGGYDSGCLIMEDFEFIERIRKERLPYKIIRKNVIVSARKYIAYGYFKVNFYHLILFLMFKFGCSQSSLARTYQKFFSPNKVQSYKNSKTEVTT